MTDLRIEVVADCPYDEAACRMPDGTYWECPACGHRWGPDGRELPTVAGKAYRFADLRDRPTDSTSASVLDQPQPD